MPAPKKSLRPKSRDDAGRAVKSGNREAKRRAEEAAMDEKAKKPIKKAYGGKMSKKPVAKKMSGGKMGKKPTKKMANGSSCRGMGAAKKGGRYSRSG